MKLFPRTIYRVMEHENAVVRTTCTKKHTIAQYIKQNHQSKNAVNR